METVLRSDWGRLFRNWESVKSDANGYPDVGREGVELQRVGMKALLTSIGILGTCMKEAPEFSIEAPQGGQGSAAGADVAPALWVRPALRTDVTSC